MIEGETQLTPKRSLPVPRRGRQLNGQRGSNLTCHEARVGAVTRHRLVKLVGPEPRRERVVLFVLSESTVLITTVLPMCYALSVLRTSYTSSYKIH